MAVHAPKQSPILKHQEVYSSFAIGVWWSADDLLCYAAFESAKYPFEGLTAYYTTIEAACAVAKSHIDTWFREDEI
jgi:hypothetical protein